MKKVSDVTPTENKPKKITLKPLESMDIIDDFLMNALASDRVVGKDFCRTLLSVLLQREISDISIQTQSFIQGDTRDYRGIRLDVEVTESINYSSDGNHTSHADCRIYDVEPGTAKHAFLPKRSRFYQAKLDSKNLASGEDDWGMLPDLYVIMIVNYDPFGEDYMMYTVRNKFEELPDKPYDDGLTFYYFYTGGKKGGNAQIKSLLTYIKSSIIDNVKDDATEKLHRYVSQVKHSSETRGKYMNIGDYFIAAHNEGREEGHAAGLTEGIDIGRSELIISMAKSGIPITQIAAIADRVCEEISVNADLL